MNKKGILKYCLALVLNIVPFYLSCLLYRGGAAVMMLFPYLQIALNILNYKWTKRIITFTGLNLAMLVSTVHSLEIITQLYYNNISSDNDTLSVGDFAVHVGIILIILMTLISIVCRIVSKVTNRSLHKDKTEVNEMTEFEIIFPDKPDEKQQKEILELLTLADREFIPPLSSRNDTLQTDFSSSENDASGIPQAYFEKILTQKFILATKKGKTLGFMSFVPDRHIPEISLPESHYISTVIVHPDFRRKGITKRFYTELMQKFSSKNISTRTWSTNNAHLSLLKKIGFFEALCIKDDRGDGIDTVYYYKKSEK